MNLVLLLLLAQTQAVPPAPQPLVEIQNLSTREHRMTAFLLPTAQELTITAVGAEPWPDRLRSRDSRRAHAGGSVGSPCRRHTPGVEWPASLLRHAATPRRDVRSPLRLLS